MKKFSVFLIALTMVFSLVLSGCNNKKETQTTSVAHTVVSQETFTEYERPCYANELFDQFLKEVEERG